LWSVRRNLAGGGGGGDAPFGRTTSTTTKLVLASHHNIVSNGINRFAILRSELTLANVVDRCPIQFFEISSSCTTTKHEEHAFSGHRNLFKRD
jgi:hypothetical protein